MTTMFDMDIIAVAQAADKMFDNKYGDKFEALKKHFIAFYNLADQLSELYMSILDCSRQLETLDGTENSEQWQTLKLVLNRSLSILHRISENSTGNLDFSFCDKFTKTF